MIRQALRCADIDAEAIDYVETHGTGTALGDPVEVHALSAVLNAGHGRPCWLGAVKTQIGHLEAASGVVGVIKAVLAMGHGRIPANQGFHTLNPKIDLGNSRLKPAAHQVQWPSQPGRLRHAGISSFGFGGTNAHLILREPSCPPALLAPAANNPAAVLHTLSAHTPQALRRLATLHGTALAQAGDKAHALTWAANHGRASLPHRLAVTAPTHAAVAQALQAFGQHRSVPDGVLQSAGIASTPPRLAFLFTGQGAQYAGMGHELYESEPVFRAVIDRCESALTSHLDVPLKEVMFGCATALLQDTRYAQPALAALQLALTQLWAEHGVHPDCVCGHSVGEYAAAVASGLMEWEDALQLVAIRARLMGSAPSRGGMLSVAAEEAAVLPLLGSLAESLDVAARNMADQVVLSGELDAMERAAACLEAAGMACTRLQVSHAFHSCLMDPVTADFAPCVNDSRLGTPRLTMVPTGGTVDADMTQPRYWIEQIRRPVVFSDALHQLKQLGVTALVEIGPGATLLSFARQVFDGDTLRVPSLRGDQSAALQWRSALGTWWATGGKAHLGQGKACGVDAVPALYPFERNRHWFDMPAAAVAAPALRAAQSFVGSPLELASETIQAFETTLPGRDGEWLMDHVVAGQAMMPAAGWIAMALHACTGHTLHKLRFQNPLVLTEPTRIQTVVAQQKTHAAVSIHKRDGNAWLACMQALAEPMEPAADWQEPGHRTTSLRALDTNDFYAALAEQGLTYGKAFQLLSDIHCGDAVACARLHPATGKVGLPLHPAWLDAAFQCAGAVLPRHRLQRTPVPVALERLQFVAAAPDAPVQVWVWLRSQDPESALVDLHIETLDKQVCVIAEGLRLQWVGPSFEHRAQAYVRHWQATAMPADTDRHWLIVGETSAAARDLATALAAHGAKVKPLGMDMEQEDDGHDTLRTAISEAPDAGILVTLDTENQDNSVEGGLALCRQLQTLLLACDAAAVKPGMRVNLLLPDRATPRFDGAAALWRSAALELPALRLGEGRIAAQSPMDRVAQALNHDAAQWRLSQGALHQAVWRPAAFEHQALASPQGAVLITGGTGALGMHLAQALWEQGARHLCLVSRQGLLPPQHQPLIASWRRSGGRIDVIACDVSQRTQVRALFEQLRYDNTVLHGIVHAAGVLDDAAIAQLRPEHWHAVTAAKACGAQWLSEYSRDMRLAYFIGYSSAAAALGCAGQCHYAAANGMLEAVLQQHAHITGTRTLTVQWGPWAGGGMADAPQVQAALRRRGIEPIEPKQALALLQAALASGQPCVLAGRFGGVALEGVAPEGVAPDGVASDGALSQELALAAQRPSLEMLVAMDKPGAIHAIRSELAQQLSQVLGLHVSQLPFADPRHMDRQRLSSLGLDSLMAMELRNRMRLWLGIDLAPHLLIGATEIGEVLESIHEKALLRSISLPTALQAHGEGGQDMEVMVL